MPFRFDALTYRREDEESICSTATWKWYEYYLKIFWTKGFSSWRLAVSPTEFGAFWVCTWSVVARKLGVAGLPVTNNRRTTDSDCFTPSTSFGEFRLARSHQTTECWGTIWRDWPLSSGTFGCIWSYSSGIWAIASWRPLLRYSLNLRSVYTWKRKIFLGQTRTRIST